MTPEEKLYTLMALAEDLQAHAQTLQTHAKTALEGLPEIVRDAGYEVRAHATRWIGICVAIVLAVGVAVGAGVSAYIRHDVGSLSAEAEALRDKVAVLKQRESELLDNTWGLKLIVWKDGTRGIGLPRGMTVDRTAPLTDDDDNGRIAVILKPIR